MRMAAGSGQMYNNINAGLAALAPENFPGTPITLSPERLQAIRSAYAGIQARPATQVSDAERYRVAQQGGFSPAELATAYPGIGFGEVNRIMGRGALQQNYAPMLQGQQTAMAEQARILNPQQRFMNAGGLAALAQGGYPRRTGQISGPGTEKSDDIPAMLSDGEFVMTAKAVRGAGKGSRRAGAKQMYKLMHQLEKNSERG
jgi:hypothetical protein